MIFPKAITLKSFIDDNLILQIILILRSVTAYLTKEVTLP